MKRDTASPRASLSTRTCETGTRAYTRGIRDEATAESRHARFAFITFSGRSPDDDDV